MEASRSEDGRFARQGVRDARTLYAILRAVAEAAVSDRPTADPRKVRVRQWRDARHLCEEEFGYIPLPQEIRRQLANLKGELLPFPELLSRAFGDRGRVRNVHSQMRAEDRSEEWMSDRNVWYALRFVARSLAPDGEITPETTIEPRPYERERQRLIAAEARKWKYGGELAARLPTYRQIGTHAETWDRALEIAELAPRPRRRGGVRAGMPVPEAIVRYYEVVGVLPTEGKLGRFRRDYGFSVARINGRFVDYLPDALALIEKRDDLQTPRPYEETKRLRVTWPQPEGGSDPAYRTHTHRYSTPQLIEWARRYVATLGPGEDAGQDSWAEFARDHPDCPSTGTVTARGGLDALIELARRPDALERAEAEHEAQLAADHEETVRSAAERPQALAVLEAMRELGGTFLRLKELSEYTGWNYWTVGNWLDILRAAGKVELVDARVGRKSARYQLTGLDLTEEELGQRAKEGEARRPQPRRIMELLAERERTGGELSETMQLDYSQVMVWVRGLRAAGYVEPLSTLHPRRHGGLRLTEAGRELLARLPRQRS